MSGSSAVLDASASGTSDVTGVQFVINGVSSSYEAMGPAVATIYGWIAEWNTISGVPAGTYTDREHRHGGRWGDGDQRTGHGHGAELND